MSDNDLIRRGVIKERMIARGWKHPDSTVTEFVEDDLPAVPREMTAREFLVAYKRMCASFPETDCSKCPIYTPYKDCTDNPCDWDIDKILPAVEKWAREHPDERSEEA